MNRRDVGYLVLALQSYKEHTKEGIKRFADKTTFREYGGISRLDNLDAIEKEELEGIDTAAHDLLYLIDRLQKYLIDEYKVV